MSQIKSTYKSLDTEETLDIVFYRPIGYAIALASKSMGIIPNAITFAGTALGIIGGHLFYYKEMNLIITGILLLMISEAMDSADGQLARMTGRFSRFGRILDGFATNLIFLSVYINLCLRLMNDGDTAAVWLLAIAAGLSHSVQSAMADYYRNGFIRFAISGKKGELDSSDRIKEKYDRLSWKTDTIEKFFLRIYLNYTVEQETFSPSFVRLKDELERRFATDIPAGIMETYRRYCKTMMKYCNILTTNTRMIVLFIVVLSDRLYLYFAFEILVLNPLLVYVVMYHERISKRILSDLHRY